MVDSLSVQVVTDGAHDIFISGAQVPGVRVERTRAFYGAQLNRSLRSEWGPSLHLTAQKGGEARRYLLDFGWMPEVLNNNLDLLRVDVSTTDALISSVTLRARRAGGGPGRLSRRTACSNSRDRRLEPLSLPSCGAHGRAEGVNTLESRATTQNFSPAILELDAAMRSGRLQHAGDPVLDWCVGNVVGKPTGAATDHQSANRDRTQLTAESALPPAQRSRAAMVLRDASRHDTGARASRAEDGTG